MSIKTLTKSLQERLVRGTVVNVANTCQNKRVRGKQTAVVSKKLSTCNGKTCAEGENVPDCNGLGVFVDNLKRRSKATEEESGWRAFTTKVCLTHILDEDGVPLLETGKQSDPEVAEPEVAEPEVAPKVEPSNNGSGRLPKAAVPTPETLPLHETVTWEQLATTLADKDFDALAILARRLKAEGEVQARRLIDAQDKVIVLLERLQK